MAWDKLWSACSNDPDTQAALDARLDLLLEKGNSARRPITAHLDDGIFELRAKNARGLFYFGPHRRVIFVHGLIKHTRKVPKSDIDIAKQRRRAILEGKLQVHDFSGQTELGGETEEQSVSSPLLPEPSKRRDS